ncbi:MAG: ROK family protein [Gemmatimonadaceae bacterium]
MRKINTLSFRRATRSTAREINRQIALNLVREHQPISRADLARRMKIGRGVVTSLITELLVEGSIFEGDTIDAPRGRRPRMLYVRTRDRLVVSIDVRLSRTYVMLNDFAGTQIALETFETLLDPAALAAELVRRVRRLREEHAAAGVCEGVGLVVPGIVDRNTGRIINAPQLGWRDVDLRGPLAEGVGCSVEIENAPIACALAQMWLGQRGAADGDFVYVTVSDGVGAGIVVNGEVLRGRDQTAGEFGHVPLDPDGPVCLCGKRGCWEVYTSNIATLSRYLGRELSGTSPRAFLQAMPLTMSDLIARSNAGDERALAALEETAHYLGLGLGTIVNALNPSKIFVCGEITAAWDRIEPTVRRAMAERVLAPSAVSTPIVPEQAGGLPRLRGATALVAAPQFAAPQVA